MTEKRWKSFYETFAIICDVVFMVFTFLMVSIVSSFIGVVLMALMDRWDATSTMTIDAFKNLRDRTMNAFADNSCIICMEEMEAEDEVV